jgi:WD40 repeat protein
LIFEVSDDLLRHRGSALLELWYFRPDSPSGVTFDRRARGRLLGLSPDGRWLVTTCSGLFGTNMLWDLRANTPARSTHFVDGQPLASCVAFTLDSCRLVTTGASPGGGIGLWDLEGASPAKSREKPLPHVTLEGYQASVSELTVSSDGRWLAVAGEPVKMGDWMDLFPAPIPTVQLFRLDVPDIGGSMRILRGHSDTVMHLAFSPNGKWLVTGSLDGTVRLWNLDLETLVDQARRLAGRELTLLERERYLPEDTMQ